MSSTAPGQVDPSLQVEGAVIGTTDSPELGEAGSSECPRPDESVEESRTADGKSIQSERHSVSGVYSVVPKSHSSVIFARVQPVERCGSAPIVDLGTNVCHLCEQGIAIKSGCGWTCLFGSDVSESGNPSALFQAVQARKDGIHQPTICLDCVPNIFSLTDDPHLWLVPMICCSDIATLRDIEPSTSRILGFEVGLFECSMCGLHSRQKSWSCVSCLSALSTSTQSEACDSHEAGAHLGQICETCLTSDKIQVAVGAPVHSDKPEHVFVQTRWPLHADLDPPSPSSLTDAAILAFRLQEDPPHVLFKEVHPSTMCDGCGTHPVIGPRWKCACCVDFDLCWQCVSTGKHPVSHDPSHVLMCFDDAMVVERHPFQSLFAAPPPSSSSSRTHDRQDSSCPVIRPLPVSSARPDAVGPDAMWWMQQIQNKLLPEGPLATLSTTDPEYCATLVATVQSLTDVDFGTMVEKHGDFAESFSLYVSERLRRRFPDLSDMMYIGSECIGGLIDPVTDAENGNNELEEAAWESLLDATECPDWAWARMPSDGLDQAAVETLLVIASKRLELDQVMAAIAIPQSMDNSTNRLKLEVTDLHGVPVCFIPFKEFHHHLNHATVAPEYKETLREPCAPLADDAILIFISHHWDTKEHPDPHGTTWATVAAAVVNLARSCVATVHALIRTLGATADQIHATLLRRSKSFGLINVRASNGRLRKGPLVSGRLWFSFVTATLAAWPVSGVDPGGSADVSAVARCLSDVLNTVLCRVKFWFDYTCIPQRPEKGSKECEILNLTLMELSSIQRIMHTVVVNRDNPKYFSRAWCVAEFLNASACKTRTLLFDTLDPAPSMDSEDEETDDESDPDVGFHSLTMRRRILFHMGSAEVQTPPEVLTGLDLHITYLQDDSEAVCRSLWAFMQLEFRLVMENWESDITVRAKSKSAPIMLAIGTSPETTMKWLNFWDRLPHCSFDEWLELRGIISQQRPQEAHSKSDYQTAFDILQRETESPGTEDNVIRLFFEPEVNPGVSRGSSGLRRDLRAIKTLVQTCGRDKLSKCPRTSCLVVYYGQVPPEFVHRDKAVVIATHCNLRRKIVRNFASALVPGYGHKSDRDKRLQRTRKNLTGGGLDLLLALEALSSGDASQHHSILAGLLSS